MSEYTEERRIALWPHARSIAEEVVGPVGQRVSALEDQPAPTWGNLPEKPAVVAAGADQAAARAAIGAGTSSLALGTSGTQAAAGNHTHTGFAATSHTHTATDLSGVVKTVNGTTPDGAGNVTVATGTGTPADASTTSKGVVQLAGDLGGTAAAPTVPGLAGKANTSHTHNAADINAGTVAIARIPTGTTGSTVALGNHVHSGYAATSHTHQASDLSGVVASTSVSSIVRLTQAAYDGLGVKDPMALYVVSG